MANGGGQPTCVQARDLPCRGTLPGAPREGGRPLRSPRTTPTGVRCAGRVALRSTSRASSRWTSSPGVLGMDPIEIRRVNGLRVGARTAWNQHLPESVGFLDTLKEVEQASSWGSEGKRKNQRRPLARSRGWRAVSTARATRIPRRRRTSSSRRKARCRWPRAWWISARAARRCFARSPPRRWTFPIPSS